MLSIPLHQVIIIHQAHDIISAHIASSFIQLLHLLLLLILTPGLDLLGFIGLRLLYDDSYQLLIPGNMIDFSLSWRHEEINFFLHKLLGSWKLLRLVVNLGCVSISFVDLFGHLSHLLLNALVFHKVHMNPVVICAPYWYHVCVIKCNASWFWVFGRNWVVYVEILAAFCVKKLTNGFGVNWKVSGSGIFLLSFLHLGFLVHHLCFEFAYLVFLIKFVHWLFGSSSILISFA